MRSVNALLVVALIVGAMAMWAGCAMMAEEEGPIPEELAILFTGNTGAELEPCG